MGHEPDTWSKVRKRDNFLERLYEAAHWEAYVASAFTREGYYTILGPTHPGDPKDFAQSIDLRVHDGSEGLPGTDPAEWQGVEVKGSAPRVSDGLVLLCSESSFKNKAGPSERLYAHFVFCSPKTGKMWAVLEGTPVIRGHTQTDSVRGHTYNVIKAEAKYIIPFSDLCKALRG